MRVCVGLVVCVYVSACMCHSLCACLRKVYGPAGTTRFVEAMRAGFLRRSPELATAEFSGELGECWQDEDVVIVPLLLGSEETHAAAQRERETERSGGITNPGCPFCTGRIAGPTHDIAVGASTGAEGNAETIDRGQRGVRDTADSAGSAGGAGPPAKRQRREPSPHRIASVAPSMCYVCYVPCPDDDFPSPQPQQASVSGASPDTSPEDRPSAPLDGRASEVQCSDGSSSDDESSSSADDSGSSDGEDSPASRSDSHRDDVDGNLQQTYPSRIMCIWLRCILILHTYLPYLDCTEQIPDFSHC